MNIKIALGSIAGAAVVHAVLAACQPGTPTGAANASEDAGGGAPTSVAVEACNKTYELNLPSGQKQTMVYAEHAYPGLSATDIAGHVTNWNPIANGPSAGMRPPGYELEPQDVLVTRDGYAAAPCEKAGGTTMFVYAP